MKTYSELIKIPTFDDRFRYLKIGGKVGEDTFGSNRYLNQSFYSSRDWKIIRDYIIARDEGCDLAILDRPIFDKIYIHHINPVLEEDIIKHSDWLFDPEFLICVSFETHNAIHYGDESILYKTKFAIRTPNDTSPWRG